MSKSDDSTMSENRGRFISLEGIEGAGKSTVIHELERVLKARGIDRLRTREPGGTPRAEAVRDLVLSRDFDEPLHPRAELLLVFAAREQHLQEVIRPALARGTWVICDRFTDATYAYQGAGRGLDDAHIAMLADWLHADAWPDLTLLLDVPESVGLARIEGRGEPDRFEIEQAEFFARARAAYLARAEAEPDRFHVIDATASLAEVRALARTAVQGLLEAGAS
ncbi:MAG: dTMP kinase [Pseudomonadota bacterium]